MNAVIPLGTPEQTMKARRAQLGLSAEELAQRVGFSNAITIEMIENGRAKIPFQKVLEFADALELCRLEFSQMVMRERYPELATYIGRTAKSAA